MNAQPLSVSCLCGGVKHIRDPETGLWTECRCLKEERRLRELENAGIPREFWDLKLADLSRVLFYEEFRLLVEEVGRALDGNRWIAQSVVFHNGTDTLRTLCASLLCRRFQKAGKSIRLVRAQRVVDNWFRRGDNEGEDSPTENFRRYACLGVQLGEEIPNKALGVILRDLYRERWDRGKYTFFTFDGERDEMQERYGYARELAPILLDREAFRWMDVT